jgi:peptidoglycan/LPS O-acetylase OafA/YrhL
VKRTVTDFPALTGVRALAAYLVFFHHFTPDEKLVGPSIYRLLTEGHIGVTIFFVLSGFLITYRYSDSLSGWRGKDLYEYFKNRFARIYPLYFILLVVTFLSLSERDVVVWFLNLTLLKTFFEDYKFTGIGPAWSLTVEETFYWSAPFLFPLLKKSLILPTALLLSHRSRSPAVWISGTLARIF